MVPDICDVFMTVAVCIQPNWVVLFSEEENKGCCGVRRARQHASCVLFLCERVRKCSNDSGSRRAY
ncbi:MAG: hypothetical protein ACXWIN_06230, partial [Burkholderiaceae bacterium]